MIGGIINEHQIQSKGDVALYVNSYIEKGLGLCMTAYGVSPKGSSFGERTRPLPPRTCNTWHGKISWWERIGKGGLRDVISWQHKDGPAQGRKAKC